MLQNDSIDPYNSEHLHSPFQLDDPFSLHKPPTINPAALMQGHQQQGQYHYAPLTGSSVTSPSTIAAGLSSPSSAGGDCLSIGDSLYSPSPGGQSMQGYPFSQYGSPPGPQHQQYLSPVYQRAVSVSSNVGSVSAQASTASSPPVRPNKRPYEAIEPDLDEQVDQGASGQRKGQRACQHCKKIKMRCTFEPRHAICNRCMKKGYDDCRIEERKKTGGPNAREKLLHEIRDKDKLIAELLHHIQDPTSFTQFGLLPNRIEASSLTRTILPSANDTLDEPTGQSRSQAPGPEQQKAAAGTLLSLISQWQSSNRHTTPTWKADASSSDDDSDDEDDPADVVDPHELQRATFASLPSEGFPLGLISRLSLADSNKTKLEQAIGELKSPSDAGSLLGAIKSEDSDNGSIPTGELTRGTRDLGLENPRYFHPGAGANLPLRQIIIDKQLSIEILDAGIISLGEAHDLFDLFFRCINPALSILDEALHNSTSVRKRCPFLFTVVCASAARYYIKKPHLFPVLMMFAKKAAASALIDGWKSVEMCQAYIILGDYAPPARRWEEDRSYLYKGLAIRIAMDLNLHRPPSSSRPSKDERAAREARNRTRVWLICHNIDRSASTQFGKTATLPTDDPVVKGAKNWWNDEYAHPFDIHLCGYVVLLRIMNSFHEIVRERGATTMNKNIDFLAVTRIFEDKFNEFREEWATLFEKHTDKTQAGIPWRNAMLPILTNYCKLVMYSFGFQSAFEKGLARGDPFFLRCWNAATTVVQHMADLGPTVLGNTAECNYVFGAFASGFLFKLLRPEFKAMVDDQQRASILGLVKRFADVLEAAAIDETHSPRLYARFLHGLVRKHSGEAAPLPAPAPARPASSSSGAGAGGPKPPSQDSQGSGSSTSKEGKQKGASATKGSATGRRRPVSTSVGSPKESPVPTSAPTTTVDTQWAAQGSVAATQLPTPIEPSPSSYSAAAQPQAQYYQEQQQQQAWTYNFPANGSGNVSSSAGVDYSSILPALGIDPGMMGEYMANGGMGQMEIDVDPLPLRALTTETFGSHMLLPGWAAIAPPQEPTQMQMQQMYSQQQQQQQQQLQYVQPQVYQGQQQTW